MRTSAALAMSEDDEDASARSDEGSRTGGDNTHGGEAGFEKGEDGEEPVGLADAMMFRGERLRAFRLMAEEAEAEAEAEDTRDVSDRGTENENGDVFDVISDGRKILRYGSYLSHQRYYDDLKHSDVQYIDYGPVGAGRKDGPGGGGRLIVEQDKSLGKGGLVSASTSRRTRGARANAVAPRRVRSRRRRTSLTVMLLVPLFSSRSTPL